MHSSMDCTLQHSTAEVLCHRVSFIKVVPSDGRRSPWIVRHLSMLWMHCPASVQCTRKGLWFCMGRRQEPPSLWRRGSTPRLLPKATNPRSYSPLTPNDHRRHRRHRCHSLAFLCALRSVHCTGYGVRSDSDHQFETMPPDQVAVGNRYGDLNLSEQPLVC